MIDILCAHIISGGSVIDFAKLIQVPYVDVAKWVTEDDARRKQFYGALAMAKEYFKASVIQELKAIASTDIRELFKPDGTVKDPAEWPDHLARAVKSIEVDELFEGYGKERTQIGITRKIQLWDKPKALELIGRSLAMFTDKTEVSGKLSLEDLVLAAAESGAKLESK
jgi:hypothetical protein